MMQPITSDFQKWSSYFPSLTSLSDTPSLVHHCHPPPFSLSMSLQSSTPSNVKVVPPSNGSPLGTSSTLASYGHTAPTPFDLTLPTDPSSSLLNLT